MFMFLVINDIVHITNDANKTFLVLVLNLKNLRNSVQTKASIILSFFKIFYNFFSLKADMFNIFLNVKWLFHDPNSCFFCDVSVWRVRGGIVSSWCNTPL